jgi:hypothetical protein
MATPGQIGFFSAARITGLMRGLTDPRLLPVPLVWNQRVPDVPANDEEVTARYVGTPLIADLIADDAKAVIVSQGRFQFQTTQVLNVKTGVGMNQGMINALERIRAQGGVLNDDTGYFAERYNQNIASAKYGVELRKEVLKLGMLLDGVSYDRLGIKMTNVTFGMYPDQKVTPSVAWSSTSGTGLSDIANLRSLSQQRYNVDLNRGTMSTPALRALVAQTEFQNQVKNVNFATLLGGPTPAAPIQGDQFLRRLAEVIIGGTGTPFTIELDDRRYWFQDNSGAVTNARIHPIDKVLLTDSANDGNGNAYDWANCPVSEGIVANMIGGTSVYGQQIPMGRGPIGYATPADPNMNPPGVITWAVARGAPRKHMNQSSAVLSVGTLSETFSIAVPNPV